MVSILWASNIDWTHSDRVCRGHCEASHVGNGHVMSPKRIIETRLTYDQDNYGMHCNYPLGLHNIIRFEHEYVDIESGPTPIKLKLDFRGGWAILVDVMGQPMYKFRPPAGVEPDYTVYEFYFGGKLYILEFRFDYIEADPERKTDHVYTD